MPQALHGGTFTLLHHSVDEPRLCTTAAPSGVGQTILPLELPQQLFAQELMPHCVDAAFIGTASVVPLPRALPHTRRPGAPMLASKRGMRWARLRHGSTQRKCATA